MARQTKRQKKLDEFNTKLWALGQEYEISYQEWGASIFLLQLTLAKNFIEPIYQIHMDPLTMNVKEESNDAKHKEKE